ncbi:mitochondrial carrier domain-containing protein [Umbelopsis sp. PMI_123]|nr:mitochondrial carrier domain-containing protein [Umbelopsis sp. PMI_123]
MTTLMNGHNAVEASSVLSPVQIDSKTVRKSTILNDSRSYVHFVAGGVGGMLGAICTSPLDVVKTRLQSTYYQQRSRSNLGTTAITKGSSTLLGHFAETGRLLLRIKQVEGARGLFKGLGPNLVGVVPARAIAFFTYGNSKKFYTELNNGKESPAVHLVSAASAGIVTATATNPIWVVKTRLQLQAAGQKVYKNSLDCTLRILKEEGIKGLYKGMSASYLGVAEGTIQWVIYEHLKKRQMEAKAERLIASGQRADSNAHAKSVQDWIGNLAAAAASKFVAAGLTYPHEVIRTRLRQPAEHGVRKYTGLWQSLTLIIKEEGAGALYGGMTAHLMRVVPNAAIMFFCYEAIVYHFAGGREREAAALKA